MSAKIKQGLANIFGQSSISTSSILLGLTITAFSSLCIASWVIRNKQHKALYSKFSNKLKNNHINIGQKINKNDEQFQRLELKKHQQIIIQNKHGEILKGWKITAEKHIRNPQRLILLFHSQHTSITENLQYIKQLIQQTVSDVLIVEYRYNSPFQQNKRSQITLKQDAQAIFQKTIEISSRNDLDIIILGKGLGAQLAIYISSLQRFRFAYRLKGIILQNPFTSYPKLKTSKYNVGFIRNILLNIYKLILKDKWDEYQNIKKIRVPIMFNIDWFDGANNKLALELCYIFQGRKILYEIKNDSPQFWKLDITNYFMQIDIFLNQLK